MGIKTRISVALSAVVVGVIGLAGSALATPVPAPTFDASTLSDNINTYATDLLTGAVALVGIVLVAYVPFQLLKMGVRYIKKWFGARGSAASPA